MPQSHCWFRRSPVVYAYIQKNWVIRGSSNGMKYENPLQKPQLETSCIIYWLFCLVIKMSQNDIKKFCQVVYQPCLPRDSAWWRHQMETLSALLAICGNSPVPGEFPAQRPVTRSFDVFFHLRLNKRLSKQSWGWWFETPASWLWRHCNAMRCGIHHTNRWRTQFPSNLWYKPHLSR